MSIIEILTPKQLKTRLLKNVFVILFLISCLTAKPAYAHSDILSTVTHTKGNNRLVSGTTASVTVVVAGNTAATNGVATTINYGDKAVVFAFSISVTGTTTINSINFMSSIAPGNYFSTGSMSSGTTAVYANSTPIAGTMNTNAFGGNGITFTPSSGITNNSNTIMYYFITMNYDNVNVSSDASIQFSFNTSQGFFAEVVASTGSYSPTNFTGSTINLGVTYDWEGFSSTSFTDVSNYRNLNNGSLSSSPTQYDQVRIGVIANPNYSANTQPTISTSQSISKLIFGPNNTPQLTISSGKTLTVSNGMTVNSSGVGTLNGPGILSIGGASTINASGTFSAGPTSVISLNNNASTLTNSGTFNLLSDATGAATIAAIPSGGTAAITGIVNAQRYITGNTTNNTYRNYRLLSCPVNTSSVTPGSSNVIDIRYLGATVNSIPGAYIAGTTGTSLTNTNRNPIIYLYRESITPGVNANTTFTSGKNVGISSATTSTPYSVTTVSTATGYTAGSGVSIPAGNGYLLYYVGPSTGETNPPTSTYAAQCTITATGYINQGTIPLYIWGSAPTQTLTYTTGTNSVVPGLTMVGNPYPSTLNLYQVYQDNKTTIGSTFYQLNEVGSNNFPTYNAASSGSSTVGGTQYVASGQGFYISVSSTRTTNTFAFNEAEKAAATNGVATFPSPTYLSLKQPAAVTNYALATNVSGSLHLKLMQDSLVYDECGIYFRNDWLDTYDKNDSFDLDGLSPEVYLSSFTSDNMRTSINALGDYTKGKRIKLYVKATSNGLYCLQLEDLVNIDTSAFNVYLVDNSKNDSLDIAHYKSYNFNFTVADTAAYHNRFVLAIERKPLPPYQLISFTGQKVNSGVQLDWKTYNEGDYTGFVLQKQTTGNQYVALDSLQSNNSSLYNYTDQNPVTGSNIYRLKQNDINGNITYSSPITIVYDPVSVGGLFSIYPNPSKELITITVSTNSTVAPNYFANIYNTSGALIVHRSVNANSWTEDITSYATGIYIIELKTNNGSLVGKSKFVKTN